MTEYKYSTFYDESGTWRELQPVQKDGVGEYYLKADVQDYIDGLLKQVDELAGEVEIAENNLGNFINLIQDPLKENKRYEDMIPKIASKIKDDTVDYGDGEIIIDLESLLPEDKTYINGRPFTGFNMKPKKDKTE